jgi:ADP-heptose:LPS heptosyltransferase
MAAQVLVHLGAGIGNIVMATPLLTALDRLGLTIDLWLSADYEETADLFRGWSIIRRIVTDPRDSGIAYDAYVPAVPPYYWPRFQSHYQELRGVVTRPGDWLFWTNEQSYYLSFARALGYHDTAPSPRLPVPPSEPAGGATTIVLAPGCKTGEMAAKRWPWFPDLAATLDDVAVVGTADDLRRWDGGEMTFPSHVRMLAGRLSLRETVELMAASAVVVANDSGLGHVAAALGVPTILMFGPTPHYTLGRFPPHVTVLRTGLPCEPCWFRRDRLAACSNRIDCLSGITVTRVRDAITRRLPCRTVAPVLAGQVS